MEVRSYDLRCTPCRGVACSSIVIVSVHRRAWVRAICIHVSAKEEWKAWNTSNVFINNFRSNDRATRADVKLIYFCGRRKFYQDVVYVNMDERKLVIAIKVIKELENMFVQHQIIVTLK